MSMPVEPQPSAIYQQEANSHMSHSGGSIGPLIVVLAVITILGVVAGMIGRLCAGRRFSGDSENDFEGWVERKCSTCIDGHIDVAGGANHIPVAIPAENGEAKHPQGDEGGGGG